MRVFHLIRSKEKILVGNIGDMPVCNCKGVLLYYYHHKV